MPKIEYKKVNYIFSVNNDVKESINNLKVNEDTSLYVSNLIRKYNYEYKHDILTTTDLNNKKVIITNFLKEIPQELMILRNHLKNCTYSTNIDDFNYKYKTIEEDFKRLGYLR